MKVSRWWLLGCFFLAVCVCVMVAATKSGRRNGPFWTNYQKLRLGMVKEQAVDILGPPDNEYEGDAEGTYYCIWRQGEQKIVLHFLWSFDPRAVYELHEKRYYPRTVWEKLRDGARQWWQEPMGAPTAVKPTRASASRRAPLDV